MTPTRTGVVRATYPVGHDGPTRRSALYVAPGAPYYAALTETADGIAVRIARSDRPRGRRLVSHDVVDAPLHLVADRLYDALYALNQETR